MGGRGEWEEVGENVEEVEEVGDHVEEVEEAGENVEKVEEVRKVGERRQGRMWRRLGRM